MFSMGNAFRIRPDDPNRVPHVWVIISDPAKNPERVVLVPMSSWESYKECVCRIDKGEHPDADHDSVVEYRFGMVVSVKTIHEKVKAHIFRPRRDDFSKELLERIHEGAKKSRFIPYDCDEILDEQGFLS